MTVTAKLANSFDDSQCIYLSTETVTSSEWQWVSAFLPWSQFLKVHPSSKSMEPLILKNTPAASPWSH